MFKSKISRVVIVRRLREVRALSAFTRIDGTVDTLLDGEELLEQYNAQVLSEAELNWRPAVEMRGEGVFIELDTEAIQAWEQSAAVLARSKKMAKLHDDWRSRHELPEAPYPGARFVLLHALSHMLIQELCLESGYSSASIRERIYSSAEADGAMAGLLLYTATPDSDGSLGGLADKGRVQQFGPLLHDALERARYCSSDPLCGHCAPGEMGHLNGAACHACLFASETSCERGNRYLGRAHVVETISQLGTGYF